MDCCFRVGSYTKTHDSSTVMTLDAQLGERLMRASNLWAIWSRQRLWSWLRSCGHMTHGRFFSLRKWCSARWIVAIPSWNCLANSRMVMFGFALVSAQMSLSTAAVSFGGRPLGFIDLKSLLPVKVADIQRWTVVELRAWLPCTLRSSRKMSQCLEPYLAIILTSTLCACLE